MAYDEALAARIRRSLADRDDVEEKHMFGGVAFMVGGHMAVGVVGDTLMTRVGPDDYARLLDEAHVREMDFTGRPLKGFLYVEPEGIATAAPLRRWVGRGVAFAAALPPKRLKARDLKRSAPASRRSRTATA
jgi:hypothetical protein